MRGRGGRRRGWEEERVGGGEGVVLLVFPCSRLATKLKQLAEQYDAREEVRTVEGVSVIHR